MGSKVIAGVRYVDGQWVVTPETVGAARRVADSYGLKIANARYEATRQPARRDEFLRDAERYGRQRAALLAAIADVAQGGAA